MYLASTPRVYRGAGRTPLRAAPRELVVVDVELDQQELCASIVIESPSSTSAIVPPT